MRRPPVTRQGYRAVKWLGALWQSAVQADIDQVTAAREGHATGLLVDAGTV
jgi:hypothetical protein